MLLQANSHWESGNTEAAKKASKMTEYMIFAAFGLGGFIITLGIITLVFFGVGLAIS